MLVSSLIAPSWFALFAVTFVIKEGQGRKQWAAAIYLRILTQYGDLKRNVP
jgi:hypothetical protein